MSYEVQRRMVLPPTWRAKTNTAVQFACRKSLRTLSVWTVLHLRCTHIVTSLVVRTFKRTCRTRYRQNCLLICKDRATRCGPVSQELARALARGACTGRGGRGIPQDRCNTAGRTNPSCHIRYDADPHSRPHPLCTRPGHYLRSGCMMLLLHLTVLHHIIPCVGRHFCCFDWPRATELLPWNRISSSAPNVRSQTREHGSCAAVGALQARRRVCGHLPLITRSSSLVEKCARN